MLHHTQEKLYWEAHTDAIKFLKKLGMNFDKFHRLSPFKILHSLSKMPESEDRQNAEACLTSLVFLRTQGMELDNKNNRYIGIGTKHT